MEAHHCAASSASRGSWKLGEYSGSRLFLVLSSCTCLLHPLKRTSAPTRFLRLAGDVCELDTRPLAIADSTLGCCKFPAAHTQLLPIERSCRDK